MAQVVELVDNDLVAVELIKGALALTAPAAQDWMVSDASRKTSFEYSFCGVSLLPCSGAMRR